MNFINYENPQQVLKHMTSLTKIYHVMEKNERFVTEFIVKFLLF